MADTIEQDVQEKFIAIIQGLSTLGFAGTPNVRDLMLEDFEPESWHDKLGAMVTTDKGTKREPRLFCVDVGRERENAGTDQCYLDIIAVRVKGYFRKSKKLELRDAMSRIVDEVYTNHQPTFGGLVSRLEGVTSPQPGTLPNSNEYAGEIITLQVDFALERQTEV